ncbi:unnamed protein product [Enterobius vermicularis]|uniref:P-type domain-containing protein n=1 Tax=Enterobius vermicularis TaxID=51028 RepID=A0A0N4VM63_ENTVE|nr:unnamed protein product [Enterobius vermicularis]
MILRVTEVFLFVLGFSSAQVAPRHSRIDCFPTPNANKERCIELGCWWDNDYEEVRMTN